MLGWKMVMLALIDADIIVFRAGFAAERNVWFLSVGGADPEQFAYKREAEARLEELLPGKYSRVEGRDFQMWSERYLEPVENALHNARTMVEGIRDELGVTDFDVRLFMSGPNNFRYDIAKTRPYKGNRDQAHRPTHEGAIRDYLKSIWHTEISDGQEADDLLGIALTQNPDDAILCSIDKDLRMVPGQHYDFIKKEGFVVTPDEAMSNFYRQLIIGDSTDNIVGIPNAGTARANKLLADLPLEEQWENVLAEYASKGGENWQDYLREQGQLLWIRRHPGEMWEPDLQGMNWDQAEEVSMI